MKNKIIIAFITFLLVACGTKIKRDYIITDTSTDSIKQPQWVKKMSYGSKKSEYKYFVSKAENVNQRLCEKGAEARTRVSVASEIASEIDEAYNEVIKSKNLDDNEDVNYNLKQTITMYLADVEIEERYWEKRSYKKVLGAKIDIDKYNCYTLARMKKNNYEKVVNLSVDKMFKSIENKEIKEEVKNRVLNDEK